MVEAPLLAAVVAAGLVLAGPVAGSRRAVVRRMAAPVAPRAARARGGSRGDAPWWRAVPARRRPDPALLPAVLEDVARSLRSGASVEQALAEAAEGEADPVRRALGRVVERLRAGDDLATALRWWQAHAGDGRVGLPVAALTLANEAGGSRAWAVDQVAATLRERLALDGELRAQTSQARLSAWVLVLAPAGFTLATAAIDGRVVAFLAGSPAGWACLATGAALDAAAGWWMARLTAAGP